MKVDVRRSQGPPTGLTAGEEHHRDRIFHDAQAQERVGHGPQRGECPALRVEDRLGAQALRREIANRLHHPCVIGRQVNGQPAERDRHERHAVGGRKPRQQLLRRVADRDGAPWANRVLINHEDDGARRLPFGVVAIRRGGVGRVTAVPDSAYVFKRHDRAGLPPEAHRDLAGRQIADRRSVRPGGDEVNGQQLRAVAR